MTQLLLFTIQSEHWLLMDYFWHDMQLLDLTLTLQITSVLTLTIIITLLHVAIFCNNLPSRRPIFMIYTTQKLFFTQFSIIAAVTLYSHTNTISDVTMNIRCRSDSHCATTATLTTETLSKTHAFS